MITSDKIKDLISRMPQKSGVYQYINNHGKIIYVGKAKDLRKRVSSYFTKKHHHPKTKLLISKINDIKYFVVPTEMDALLLENNFIKKYKPRYNVMLKDDKTYPFICIKNEPYPRVFSTRKVIKDGSIYLGPYTSVRLVKTLLEFVHELYPLRTCRLNLTQENIKNQKFKLCLEYHIGNCLAPCENLQSEENYQVGINHINKILQGDIKSVVSFLKKRMKHHSEHLEFEKAQILKEKLRLLENYQSKSTIVNPRINNVDVFTIVSDDNAAFVNYLKISSGSIIQTHTVELRKKLNETDEELLIYAITELRQRFHSVSRHIYSSINIHNLWKETRLFVPKIGEKYKLIQLSKRNARYMQYDQTKKINESRNRLTNKNLIKRIQLDLSLKRPPTHIECFDNSNLQGSNAVASCIVFKNGKPSKKDYRKFNIKTVCGPDDFSSMEEVVYRRYKRLIDEEKSLPQLVIIDGGKGQLSSAVKSIKKLNLFDQIQIVAIAKKLEDIFFYGETLPLYLDKRSSTLKFIQRIRNESHRFAITHHRNKRSKDMLITSLDQIEGIGKKTIEVLISYFGSVDKIKDADSKDIIQLVGNHKAQKIIIYLQKK